MSQVTPQRREELVDGFLPAGARRDGLAYDVRETVPNAPDLPIEQLRMPVQLVGAADDPYRTAEVVTTSGTRIPGATILVLESGGHVLVGQEERLRQEVRAFLEADVTAGGQAPEVVALTRLAANRPLSSLSRRAGPGRRRRRPSSPSPPRADP